jgi:hypothetical protein
MTVMVPSAHRHRTLARVRELTSGSAGQRRSCLRGVTSVRRVALARSPAVSSRVSSGVGVRWSPAVSVHDSLLPVFR